jgi:hypothetical protein
MTRTILLAAAWLAMTGPGIAATQYYYTGAATNTESLFNFDLGNSGLTIQTLINFSSVTGLNGISTSVSGVDFTGLGGNLTVPGTQLLSPQGTFFGTTVEPGLPVYAIGFHVVAGAAGGVACFVDCSVQLNLSGSPQFFGIIGTGQIPQFDMFTFGAQLAIQDFTIGTFEQPAETPEPGTLFMLGAGLTALPVAAAFRRRKRR